MAKITEDMLIIDVLRIDAGLAQILRNHGMNCVGCPSARGESLSQAAQSHGMDPESLVEELNVYLSTQGAVVS